MLLNMFLLQATMSDSPITSPVQESTEIETVNSDSTRKNIATAATHNYALAYFVQSDRILY